MAPHSPLIGQWNDCKDAAVKIDSSIQETSTTYTKAVKELTDGKDGTMQERLQQYRFWLEEGMSALIALEQGEYKEFCDSVDKLLESSNDDAMKVVPIETRASEGANRAQIIAGIQAKLEADLSRVRSSIEAGLEFCDEHEDI